MREWLELERIKHGYSKAKMASMLGISESYYFLIEAGERQKKMDMELAGKLSGILQIPIIEIIDNERRQPQTERTIWNE